MSRRSWPTWGVAFGVLVSCAVTPAASARGRVVFGRPTVIGRGGVSGAEFVTFGSKGGAVGFGDGTTTWIAAITPGGRLMPARPVVAFHRRGSDRTSELTPVGLAITGGRLVVFESRFVDHGTVGRESCCSRLYAYADLPGTTSFSLVGALTRWVVGDPVDVSTAVDSLGETVVGVPASASVPRSANDVAPAVWTLRRGAKRFSDRVPFGDKEGAASGPPAVVADGAGGIFLTVEGSISQCPPGGDALSVFYDQPGRPFDPPLAGQLVCTPGYDALVAAGHGRAVGGEHHLLPLAKRPGPVPHTDRVLDTGDRIVCGRGRAHLESSTGDRLERSRDGGVGYQLRGPLRRVCDQLRPIREVHPCSGGGAAHCPWREPHPA
jgi:hypothetical protein